MPDAPQDVSLFTWVLAGIATVIGTLASVIGLQYKKNESLNAQEILRNKEEISELKVKAENCEKDRLTLSVECATIRSRAEHLETRLHDLEKKIG
jgi:hypothetical protein